MSSAISFSHVPLPLPKSSTGSSTTNLRDTLQREKAPPTAPPTPNVFLLVEMSVEMSTQLQLENTTLEIEEANFYDEYLESAELELTNSINEEIQEHTADGGEGSAVDIAPDVAKAVHLIGAAAIRLTS